MIKLQYDAAYYLQVQTGRGTNYVTVETLILGSFGSFYEVTYLCSHNYVD